MLIKLFSIAACAAFVCAPCSSECLSIENTEAKIKERSPYYNEFENHPFIPRAARKKIAPFLLPLGHPAKPVMDALFLDERVTESDETLGAAGFQRLYKGSRSHIRLLKHDLLPDYLLKVVPDDDERLKKNIESWEWFVRRCNQARRIQTIINQFKIKHFVVAQKWIYILPPAPAPASTHRNDVVLLVTDMHLVSRRENDEAWRTMITPKHLDELYLIMDHTKSITYRPDNIVYTVDGKFAFIDTEYSKHPCDFSKITPLLNEEMQAYWRILMLSGGPRMKTLLKK